MNILSSASVMAAAANAQAWTNPELDCCSLPAGNLKRIELIRELSEAVDKISDIDKPDSSPLLNRSLVLTMAGEALANTMRAQRPNDLRLRDMYWSAIPNYLDPKD